MKLSPDEIYFSHDSISSLFKCKRRIEDTYKELRDGDTNISAIPKMTVSDVDGEWFAWDGNRRLWVFKKLAMEGKIQKIKVYVTDEPIPRRYFTTKCDGRAIKVRGRSDLAFPPRGGPSFCARFEDHATQQSFLDSVTAGTLRSLALSYDKSGYFYLQQDGGWKYRGIPSDLADLLGEKEFDSVDPTYVALGRGERYFVKFDDGSMYWEASNTFTKAVKRLGKRQTVDAVAFAPEGGWWMSTSKGSQWDDLPEDLEEELQDADCSADFVSISEYGDAWFVDIDGTAHWKGLDKGCRHSINEHGPGVSRITFGKCHWFGFDDVVLEFY
eukprot:Skav208569  [mRNA]  locus=scaffold177:142946:143926:+ [translate_table: standard]